jgi:hypothetical protein
MQNQVWGNRLAFTLLIVAAAVGLLTPSRMMAQSVWDKIKQDAKQASQQGQPQRTTQQRQQAAQPAKQPSQAGAATGAG